MIIKMNVKGPFRPKVFRARTVGEKAPLDRDAIGRALAEDAPSGDITTSLTVPEGATARAVLMAKQDLVAAGLDVFAEVFKMVDPSIRVRTKVKDGVAVRKAEVMARIFGPAGAILRAERVALNYLIRMCSVATLAASYVAAVKGTKATILDTRKTTPGLRDLEKYSVRAGGAMSHRRDLSAMVLIKENHIAVAGGVEQALAMARKGVGKKGFIEIEVTSLSQLQEAIGAGADMVLLDNMTPAMMKKAVLVNQGRVWLEASGNMTLQRAAQAAGAGVDFISVGALTHSAPAVDLSLLVEIGAK